MGFFDDITNTVRDVGSALPLGVSPWTDQIKFGNRAFGNTGGDNNNSGTPPPASAVIPEMPVAGGKYEAKDQYEAKDYTPGAAYTPTSGTYGTDPKGYGFERMVGKDYADVEKGIVESSLPFLETRQKRDAQRFSARQASMGTADDPGYDKLYTETITEPYAREESSLRAGAKVAALGFKSKDIDQWNSILAELTGRGFSREEREAQNVASDFSQEKNIRAAWDAKQSDYEFASGERMASQEFASGERITSQNWDSAVKEVEMVWEADQRSKERDAQERVASARGDEDDGCIIVTACHGRYSREVNITRQFRDTFLDERTLRGYYVIAEPAVRLMKRFSFVKSLIRKLLVVPLIKHGKHVIKGAPPSFTGYVVAKLFLSVCSIAGRRESFNRINGEVV